MLSSQIFLLGVCCFVLIHLSIFLQLFFFFHFIWMLSIKNCQNHLRTNIEIKSLALSDAVSELSTRENERMKEAKAKNE